MDLLPYFKYDRKVIEPGMKILIKPAVSYVLIITETGLSPYIFPFPSFPFLDSITPSLSNTIFYVCVGRNMHPMASVCQWKDNLWGQFLRFFFHVGFQDQTQVTRLSDMVPKTAFLLALFCFCRIL